MKMLEFFKHQQELAEKFHAIEYRNGFHEDVFFQPVNIQSYFGQALLRRYAWQITEEVCEALEEKIVMQRSEAFEEEIADVFHFLLEFGLLINADKCSLFSWESSLKELFEVARLIQSKSPTESDAWLDFLRLLSQSIAMLKNKPWKQTHTFVDSSKFDTAYCRALMEFIIACSRSGITAERLEQAFFAKKSKNEQRISDGA